MTAAEKIRRYEVATDRQQRCGGRFQGQSMVVDERGQYVTDDAGEVLTFPLAYDAQRWIERRWLTAIGVDPNSASADR